MSTSRCERWLRAAPLAAVVALLGGCSSSGKGEGSESHFFACEVASDCPAQAPYCVSGECRAEPDAGAVVGDSGTPPPDGGVSRPDAPACGPLPPADFRCVQFCGTDRPALDMVCVGDRYQCPAETPVRLADCPEDTCWFPGATCCGNDGDRVPGRCPGGGEMQCPPGSAPRDSAGACPAACTAPGTTGSLAVDFRVTNDSGAPIGLWASCQLAHRITACVDGYEAPLPTWTFCTPDCPATACPTCGACGDAPAPVSPVSPAAIYFGGELFETVPQSGACACAIRSDVPGGSYRVTVPVFEDTPVTLPGGGYYRTALYEVSVDFELPDADGIVDVPIDVAPFVEPCAGSGACVAWRDPADPTTGCAPEPATPSDCPPSAPQRYRCAAPVPVGPGCVDPANNDPGSTSSGGVVRCCP